VLHHARPKRGHPRVTLIFEGPCLVDLSPGSVCYLDFGFVLWPLSSPVARQQVLKVLDALSTLLLTRSNVSATKIKHDCRHTSTYSSHSLFPLMP